MTLLACAVLVVSRLGEFAHVATLSKFVASSGFLAVAASSGAFQSRYGKVLFAGLLLSAIGDMFLLGTTKQLFLLGLVSFLLAHVVYVGAFLTWGINVRWSVLAAIPVVVIAFSVSAWLTSYLTAEMVLPIRVYTAVISIMVIAAFGTWGAGGPTILPIGALLFYASDLSVAAGRFVAPDFPNYVWGLPFYYSGQVLLALSVAAAVGRQRVSRL